VNRSELIQAIADLGKVILTIENVEGIKPKMKRRDVAALERIIADYARQLRELIEDEAPADLANFDAYVPGSLPLAAGHVMADAYYDEDEDDYLEPASDFTPGLNLRIKLVHGVDERP